MKKLFLSLVFAVLAMCASAAVGDILNIDYLSYEVVSEATSSVHGEVYVKGLNDWGEICEDLELKIPSTVKYSDKIYDVTVIKASAFENKRNIKVVDIRYGIHTIQDKAFSDCRILNRLRIPSSVTKIGSKAFANTFGLKEVYVAHPDPASIKIYDDAFSNSSAGMTLFVPKTHPNTVERYKNVHAFWIFFSYKKSSEARDFFVDDGGYYCVTKPATRTTPGEMTLVGFSKETTIAAEGAFVPNTYNGGYTFSTGYTYNVTAIADSACLDNTDVQSIDFSRLSGLKSIGTSAFQGCTNLITVNINTSSLITIGDLAFSKSPITKINVPEKVNQCPVSFVEGCSGLKEITVATGNMYYSSVNGIMYNKAQTRLMRCPEGWTGAGGTTALADSDFPKNLSVINQYAFSGCHRITSVQMPYGVNSIESYAFNLCSNLSEAKIPSTVNTFGNGLFNSTSLTWLFINKTVPPTVAADVFNGASKTNLCVPYESIDAYKTANVWKTWGNITQGAYDIGKMGHFKTSNSTLNGTGYTIHSAKAEMLNGVWYDGRAKLTSQMSSTSAGTLTIPAYVTDACSGKKYIVTSIGSKVCYRGMGADMTLTLGENVDSVGAYAFYGMNNLTKLNVNPRLRYICAYAFYDCRIGGAVDLPYGFKQLLSGAFSYNSLTHLLIPSSVTRFISNAIAMNGSLKELVINNSQWANYDNWDLTYVPSSCKLYVPTGSVQQYRNNSAWGQLNVVAGAYDFTFNNYAMNNTRYHMTVTSNTPVTVGGVTYAGKAKYVYHPSNATASTASTYRVSNYETYASTGDKYLMTEFGDSALYGISDVTTVSISSMKHLERIGAYAFGATGITKFTVPSTVTEIGKYAFLGCRSLEELVLLEEESTRKCNDQFYGRNASNFHCYVMWKDYPTYKSKVSGWSKFSTESNTPLDRLNSYFLVDFNTSALTFSVDHPVDWSASGINACIVCKYEPSKETAYTQEVDATPAGTGLLVDGFTRGTIYLLNRPSTTPSAPTNNLLKGTATGSVNVYQVNVGYLFNNVDNYFTRPTSNVGLGIGSAYLQIPSNLAGSTTTVKIDRYIHGLLGDVDGNGVVNVSDVTALINKILGIGDYSDSVCDINADGVVNVSDATALINIILG